jgi:hypothetical protein
VRAITSSVDFRSGYDRTTDVLEMPNQDANRVMRSVKENGWRVSAKLVAEYPRLADELLARRVVDAVQSAFEQREALP